MHITNDWQSSSRNFIVFILTYHHILAISIHPGKLTNVPQKGTISIGNTSSNHWFSGNMLVLWGVGHFFGRNQKYQTSLALFCPSCSQSQPLGVCQVSSSGRQKWCWNLMVWKNPKNMVWKNPKNQQNHQSLKNTLFFLDMVLTWSVGGWRNVFLFETYICWGSNFLRNCETMSHWKAQGDFFLIPYVHSVKIRSTGGPSSICWVSKGSNYLDLNSIT